LEQQVHADAAQLVVRGYDKRVTQWDDEWSNPGDRGFWVWIAAGFTTSVVLLTLIGDVSVHSSYIIKGLAASLMRLAPISLAARIGADLLVAKCSVSLNTHSNLARDPPFPEPE
jgi:heme exporter protein D